MMASKWYVWGEHGIHHDDLISETIEADSMEDAIDIFIDHVIELPEWKRMGRHNVYARKIL